MLYNRIACPHRMRMGACGDSAEKDPPNPCIPILWEKGALYKKRASLPCISPGTDLSACSVDEKAFRRFCNYLPSIFLTPNRTTFDHASVSMTFCIDALTCWGRTDAKSRFFCSRRTDVGVRGQHGQAIPDSGHHARRDHSLGFLDNGYRFRLSLVEPQLKAPHGLVNWLLNLSVPGHNLRDNCRGGFEK